MNNYVGIRYRISNDEVKNHDIQEMLFQKGYKWCTGRDTYMTICAMLQGERDIKPWWIYTNEKLKHIFWRVDNDPITNEKNNLYGEYKTSSIYSVPEELFVL